jgi:hypothetical protein
MLISLLAKNHEMFGRSNGITNSTKRTRNWWQELMLCQSAHAASQFKTWTASRAPLKLRRQRVRRRGPRPRVALRGNEWVAGIVPGAQCRQGVGRGRSGRARGQADGLYEVDRTFGSPLEMTRSFCALLLFQPGDKRDNSCEAFPSN